MDAKLSCFSQIHYMRNSKQLTQTAYETE